MKKRVRKITEDVILRFSEAAVPVTPATEELVYIIVEELVEAIIKGKYNVTINDR